MTSKTKSAFLDLDSVVPEREISVKLDGKKHKLVPASVKDFIENIRTIEKLQASIDQVEAFETTIGLIAKAFPSIGEERLRELTMPQAEALAKFAQANNGQNDVEKEAVADAKANPPAAV